MAGFRRPTGSSHRVITVAMWWGLAEASASASRRPLIYRPSSTFVTDGETPAVNILLI